MSDDCLAAQDRCVGVHDNPILDRRMAFHAADKVSVGVGGKAQRAQGDALVQLHMIANLARFADHDARAMVDEEVVADRRAGMDVDSRFLVCPLGHHAWNERHAQPMQFVRQAVDRYGPESRIAENHFVQALARRVAVIRRLDIRRQQPAQVGDPLEEVDRHRLALGFEVGFLIARIGILDHAVLVPQRASDLCRELIVQTVNQVAHVVRDVARMQTLSTAVSGINDLFQIFQAGHDHLILRQRAMSQVIDPADFLVGRDDFVGKPG